MGGLDLLRSRRQSHGLGVQIVAIANDITFNSGAFGTKEDAVFRAATEHALEEKLPLFYLAANAGARVGLAQEVKQCLQVGLTSTHRPDALSPFPINSHTIADNRLAQATSSFGQTCTLSQSSQQRRLKVLCTTRQLFPPKVPRLVSELSSNPVTCPESQEGDLD